MTLLENVVAVMGSSAEVGDVFFKLDTGASVSVIACKEPILQRVKLVKSDKVLMGHGQATLDVLGKFTATISYKDVSTEEVLYVVDRQEHSLLSKGACERLKLLTFHVDSVSEYRAKYSELFEGLGELQDYPYTITLKDDVSPVALTVPRRVPYPLLPKVKTELDRMVAQGVISKVETPTDWCSGLVVVPKANKTDVRLCVDLTQLNKAVKREFHPMSSVDDSLAKLINARYFTRLDANSGFWQIPLDSESQLLTTFITQYGRFCFHRLCFGISSAPEIFQRTMNKILEGISGVICHMDDVLIHGTTREEHDQRVDEVMEKIQRSDMTLNNKCEFSMTSTKFLGFIIDEGGIHADPSKVAVISKFPAPQNVTELQRFLGMVNQMGRFAPNLTSLTSPLRELLRKDVMWTWDIVQQNATECIKKELCTTPTLAWYDATKPLIISADASSWGQLFNRKRAKAIGKLSRTRLDR